MLKRKISSGFTLIEVIVAMALLTVIGVLVTRVLIDTMHNTKMIESIHRLKTNDEISINEIQKMIDSSKFFIGRTADPDDYEYGTEYYLEKIELPVSFKIGNNTYFPLNINSRKLPEINSNISLTRLDLDPQENRRPFLSSVVGNSLMFGNYQDTITFTGVDNDGDPITRVFDILQINYFYLAKLQAPGNMGITGQSFPISLIKWQSLYYIDYPQIKAFLELNNYNKDSFISYISTAKANTRKEIKIDGVWNYNAKNENENRFYNLTLNNAKNDLTVKSSTYEIPLFKQSRAMKLDGQESGIVYSIAANNTENIDTKNISPSNWKKVPALADPDNNGDGFPHGFEIMISGSSGSRKIYFRIVRVAGDMRNKNYNQTTTIMQGRDS